MVVAVVALGLSLFGAVLYIVRLHQKVQSLGEWKVTHPRTDADVAAARKESVARSRTTVTGTVQEQMVPLLPEFGAHFNFRDARFIGKPVDYIVFDGFDEGKPDARVVFVEIKTGKSQLSSKQRRIRDAVKDRRVEWFEVHLAGVEKLEPTIDWASITTTVIDAEEAKSIVWEDNEDD